MPQKQKIIIFLYNRFFDPLIQGNFWLYIKDYLENENNPYQFHLITYENPEFPLTEEQDKLIAKWKEQGQKSPGRCRTAAWGLLAVSLTLVPFSRI